MKKVIENFEFEKCPNCGELAEWEGSSVEIDGYYDSYNCSSCGTHYTIIFDMKYKCHFVD